MPAAVFTIVFSESEAAGTSRLFVVGKQVTGHGVLKWGVPGRAHVS